MSGVHKCRTYFKILGVRRVIWR